jgi:hypothetical protein
VGAASRSRKSRPVISTFPSSVSRLRRTFTGDGEEHPNIIPILCRGKFGDSRASGEEEHQSNSLTSIASAEIEAQVLPLALACQQ